MKKLFTYPQYYNYRGELSKKWFVYYSYRNPFTGKMQRIREYEGLTIGTAKERNAAAKKLVHTITQKLNAGYNPFMDNTPKSVYAPDSFCIETNLTDALDKNQRWIGNSRKSYKNAVTQLCAWLTLQKRLTSSVLAFTEDDANSYLDYMIGVKNFSPTTRNNHRGFLGTVFNIICKKYKRQKINFDNPFLLTEKIPEDRRGRTPFTQEQTERIKKYLVPRDLELWLACLFVRYTMVRTTEELPYLKLSDIDVEKMKLTVRGEISKNHKTQRVDLHPDIIELMQQQNYFSYPTHFYIFSQLRKPHVNSYGHNALTKRFSAVRDHLKFSTDYSMYSFKHTGNAEMHTKRVPMPKIRDQNRHSDLRTTDIYSKQFGFYNEENIWK